MGIVQLNEALGTQFTCFTSTKVQILTQKGFKVHTLTQKAAQRGARYSVYLLY